MQRPNFEHGFPSAAGEAAKAQAREVMIVRARSGRPISYSELVSSITEIELEAHDPRLAHFLGEIAEAEDQAGRGLLTAVVVHKTGDKRPGPGFFELAQVRGRDVSDREACWIAELNRLNEYWSARAE